MNKPLIQKKYETEKNNVRMLDQHILNDISKV